MIIPDGVWTENDAKFIADVMRSPTWSRLIQIMQINRPRIEGQTRDDRYDESLKRQAWEDCLNTFAVFNQPPTTNQEDELEQPDMSKFSPTAKQS